MDGEDIEPLEWDAMENPFAQIVPVSIKDGCIQVPDKIEIDTELVEAYVWDSSSYI